MGGQVWLKAVLPTIIIKHEDLNRIIQWQETHSIPIHIWHVFFDLAYGISLNKAQEVIDDGLVAPTIQVFQAPGGATTKKAIYKIYHHYAYNLGVSSTPPELDAQVITDKNGHILPYVSFQGGKINLADNALAILREIAND